MSNPQPGIPYAARVEIYQECGPRQIDRTFPVVLNGFLTEGEWQEFCNELDAKLLVVHHYTLTFLFLVTIGAATASAVSNDPLLFLYFMVPGLVFVMFTSACVQCATAHGLQQICERWTQRSVGRLSFHQRGSLQSQRETPHIEIYILPSLSRGGDYDCKNKYGTSSYQPPTAVVAADSSTQETQQRLQALETLRPILTDQEYQSKRADILAMV